MTPSGSRIKARCAAARDRGTVDAPREKSVSVAGGLPATRVAGDADWELSP